MLQCYCVLEAVHTNDYKALWALWRITTLISSHFHTHILPHDQCPHLGIIVIALKGALRAQWTVCVHLCSYALLSLMAPPLHLRNLLLLSPSGEQMVSIATGTRKFSFFFFFFSPALKPQGVEEHMCVSVCLSALPASL